MLKENERRGPPMKTLIQTRCEDVSDYPGNKDVLNILIPGGNVEIDAFNHPNVFTIPAKIPTLNSPSLPTRRTAA